MKIVQNKLTFCQFFGSLECGIELGRSILQYTSKRGADMAFDDLVREMNGRDFIRENPVLLAAKQGERELASAALSQYSGLIMVIVQLLKSGKEMAEKEGWIQVQKELDRNIREEEGSRTAGIPHRVIIAYHFKRLGLAWPGSVIPSLAEFRSEVVLPNGKIDDYDAPTRNFLNALGSAKDRSPSFHLGTILALETTAGPELCFVARTINSIVGEELVPEAVIVGGRKGLVGLDTFSLAGFFAFHIHVWEEGHQAGLEFAISQTEGVDREELTQGFRYTLDLMDKWWAELAKS